VDDARAALTLALAGTGLTLVQFTGAICPAEGIFRPGLWIVLQESAAAHGTAMSPAGRERVAQLADMLRTRFGLS
jgi:hypothetical protein